MATTELVPGINLNDLMANRQRLLEMSRSAFTTLLEVERLSVASGFKRQWLFCWDGIRLDPYHIARFQEDPVAMVMAGYTKQMDACGWEHLLHATGLRTFMDSKAREEWDKSIKNRDTPAFEIRAIEATFRHLYEQRGAMVERGVVELFKRLSWDYKSNNPCLFGKKVVVTRFLDYSGTLTSDGGGLEDLERAMCVFDGKPEPDHRAGIMNQARQARDEMQLETNNLHIRWFKNGNAHATFKRLDLVGKINQVIGKHYPGALPAPPEEKRKC